jgi:hypothetical protein
VAVTTLAMSTHLVCMCTKERVIHYLGVLKELVGRGLAGREQRLAVGGCGMRCGAVAC